MPDFILNARQLNTASRRGPALTGISRVGQPAGPRGFPPPPPPPPVPLVVDSINQNLGLPNFVNVTCDQGIYWAGDVPQWVHQESGEVAIELRMGTTYGPVGTVLIGFPFNVNAGDHIVIPGGDLSLQSRSGGLIAARTVVVG